MAVLGLVVLLIARETWHRVSKDKVEKGMGKETGADSDLPVEGDIHRGRECPG